MENLKNINLQVKLPDFSKLKEQLKPVTLSNNISQLVNRYRPSSLSATKDDESDDIEYPGKKKKSTLKRQNATKRSHEARPEPRTQNAPTGISTISGGIPVDDVQPPKHKFLNNFSIQSLKTDSLSLTKGLILSIPSKLIKKEKVDKKKSRNEVMKVKPTKKDIVHEHFYPRNDSRDSFDDFDSDDDDDLDDFEEEILSVEVENKQLREVKQPIAPVVPPRRRKSLHIQKEVSIKGPAPGIPHHQSVTPPPGLVKNESTLYKVTQPIQNIPIPPYVPSPPREPPLQSRVRDLKASLQISSDTSFEDFARSRSVLLNEVSTDLVTTDQVQLDQEQLDIFNKAQSGDVFQEFDDIFHNGPPTQDSLPTKTIHKASTVSDLRFTVDKGISTKTKSREVARSKLKTYKSADNKKFVTVDEKVTVLRKPFHSSKSSSFSSSYEDNLEKSKRKIVQRRPSTSITVQDYRYEAEAIPRCKSIISPKHKDDSPVQLNLKTKSEPNLPELKSPMLIKNSVEQVKKPAVSILKKTNSSQIQTEAIQIKSEPETVKNLGKITNQVENEVESEVEKVKEEPKVEPKPKLSQFSTFSMECPSSSIKPTTIPTIYPLSWVNKSSIMTSAALPKPYRSTILSSISHAPKAKLPKAADSYLKQIQNLSTSSLNQTRALSASFANSKPLELDVRKLSHEHLVSSSSFNPPKSVATFHHVLAPKDLAQASVVAPGQAPIQASMQAPLQVSVRKTFIYYNDQDQVDRFSNPEPFNSIYSYYHCFEQDKGIANNIPSEGIFI